MKERTKTQVAGELGISASTLLRYIRSGILPTPRRHPVNHWRVWSEDEVAELERQLRLGDIDGGEEV